MGSFDQLRGGDGPMVLVNGIDGATGDYLIPPIAATAAAQFVLSEPVDVERQATRQAFHERMSKPDWGPPFYVRPENVHEAGWGIVFHKDEDPDVRLALQPLIDHRRGQIGNDELVKVLDYSGETVRSWLGKYRVDVGDVHPTRVPYYLLLVGHPERIPFAFGHLLDVMYAVGRLHFDNAAGYRAYVASLLQYERDERVPNGRDVLFFGPRHSGDGATRLSADVLLKTLADPDGGSPVLKHVTKRTGITYRPTHYSPAESTKATLSKLFHRPAASPIPAFLFTASHGMGWPAGSAAQESAQGALLCQDYQGRSARVRPEHYFAASDLGADARVHGMVCFHFACFSVGTPKEDRFFHRRGAASALGSEARFSTLPKALLSHRNGGALAVIGHVERAWASSIETRSGPQIGAFESAIGYVLIGYPLGWALKDFNDRYAMKSAELSELIERRGYHLMVPDEDLAERWTERNDAEAYVLFGDPATRVRLEALLD